MSKGYQRPFGFVLGITIGVAPCTLCAAAGVADEPPSVSSVVQRAGKMYSLSSPFELRGRVPWRVDAFPPGEQAVMDEFLSAYEHPRLTGRRKFFFEDTVRFDGVSRLRYDRLNLSNGGPPERSTIVRLFVGTKTILSDEVGAAEAESSDRATTPAPGQEGRAFGRRDCMLGIIGQSFPHLCRGVLAAIAESPDAMFVSQSEDRAVVFSAAAAARATLSLPTGEVLSLDLAWPDDRVQQVWTDGWLEGQVFPARHPRELGFTLSEPGAGLKADTPPPSSEDGPSFVCLSASRLEKPDATAFEWSSFAKRLKIYETGEVIGPDGAIISSAEEARSQSAPAKPLRMTDETLSPGVTPSALKPRDPLFVGILAAGVACLIAALGVWVRRRMHS